MRIWSALLAAASVAYGATVTVCASGCTTTSLQTALNTTAVCGDTIAIKSTEPQTGNYTFTDRGCTGANPITVTSDRAAWLPPAGARITPSHLPNMAVLISASTDPVMRAVLSGGGDPARGWVFRGIAFRGSTGTVYTLVALNHYEAASVSDIAQDIIFDQCYFYSLLPDTEGQRIQNILRADGINVTVKNSYFGEGVYPGTETHAVQMLTSPGPVTIENNYITAAGIPIFSGGAVPSYPTYIADGITARYNYSWRPYKWNGDPEQPYAEQYVANVATSGVSSAATATITDVSNTGVLTHAPDGYYSSWPIQFVWTIASVGGCTIANGTAWRAESIDATHTQLLDFPGCNAAYTSGGTATAYAFQPCLKNHGEFKFGQNITFEYNVGENSPFAVACESQYNGFTGTFRSQWDGSWANGAMGTVSFTDTTHLTWSGSYRIGGSGAQTTLVGDVGVCVSMPTTGTECHAVSSFTGASLVTSTAFSAAPMSPGGWWITYTYGAGLCNMSVKHNVFRNVAQGMTNLGLSYSANACVENNHYEDNLIANTDGYTTPKAGLLAVAGEADYATSIVPTDFSWNHNTLYSPEFAPFAYFSATGCGNPTCKTSIQPKYTDSSYSNNLTGETASGGNGPFSGDANGTISDTVNFYFTNATIKNNVLPGATVGTGCTGGNTCSGNIVSAWADPFGGLAGYKVLDAATYAGSDGRVIGADVSRLPLIQNVRVTPQATHALLEFDLTQPIRLASTTQPCALEVSSDSDLHTGLNTYAVVNALNPAYFKQGDATTGANALLPAPVIAGSTVQWPIGRNATVTDDNGVSRSLALTPSTLYYGRLMCYGDTQRFTFTTTASDPGASSTTINLGSVPTGTTTVRLHYGSTPAMSSSSDTSATGAVAITLPLSTGYTYYQLEYRNGGGSIKYGPANVVVN